MGILIFAVISIIVLAKLYKVLGDTKYDPTEQMKQKTANKAYQEKNEMKDVTPKPEKGVVFDMVQEAKYEAQYGKKIWSELKQINQLDSNVTPENFMIGAKLAFELILKAYSKADRDSLKVMVSKDIYQTLDEAMKIAEARGEQLENTLIAIHKADITDVTIEKKMATITVVFETEQVNLVKDREGKLLEGDPTDTDRITDIWTFRRNLGSSDPNWLLIRTQTPQG